MRTDICTKAIDLLSLTRLKKAYKMLRFRKYASFGADLEISARSDCSAMQPGTITIGDHCRVFGRLQTQDSGEIRIGNHSCVYLDSIIGSVSSIRIGDYVVISNHVHIYDNNNHPTDPQVRKNMCIAGFDGDAWLWRHSDSAPIVIEDNVWIGEYAAVLKGVTIGTGAVVASHAVVTKDVPPYTIVAGNPARVVKELNHEA